MPLPESEPENIIHISCEGELTIHEIFQYFADVEKDGSINAGCVELVDLGPIRQCNIDSVDASVMPGQYQSARLAKKIKGTILFGSNEFNEGLAELIKAHFNKAMPEHFFITVSKREQALAAAAKILE